MSKQAMQTVMSSVIDFHRVHQVPMRAAPGIPADERVRLRARLLVEELGELLAAMFHDGEEVAGTGCCSDSSLGYAVDQLQQVVDGAPVRVNLVEVADALADIQYVTIGAALEFGIPHDAVWAEVCRSNASKAGGGKRPDGKIIKGPNYSPPNIRAILFPPSYDFTSEWMPVQPAAMLPQIPDEPIPYTLNDVLENPGAFFEGAK